MFRSESSMDDGNFVCQLNRYINNQVQSPLWTMVTPPMPHSFSFILCSESSMDDGNGPAIAVYYFIHLFRVLYGRW